MLNIKNIERTSFQLYWHTFGDFCVEHEIAITDLGRLLNLHYRTILRLNRLNKRPTVIQMFALNYLHDNLDIMKPYKNKHNNYIKKKRERLLSPAQVNAHSLPG